MSAVKDGLPIIGKQLAIRLSLFKQIAPKLFDSGAGSVVVFLCRWRETSVSSSLFLFYKSENKLKVSYQNSLLLDYVHRLLQYLLYIYIFRFGMEKSEIISTFLLLLLLLHIMFVLSNFCCCWKCAIKMLAVLLKPYLIVWWLIGVDYTWKASSMETLHSKDKH